MFHDLLHASPIFLRLVGALTVVALACVPGDGGSDSEASASTSTASSTASASTTTGASESASGSTGTESSSSSTSSATASSATSTTASSSSSSSSSSTSDTCDGGCSLAPLCGDPCVCCCPCTTGETLCGEVEGAPAILTCVPDGCFEPTPCGADEACVDEGGSATCTGARLTCDSIEAEYDAAVHAPDAVACADVSECKVIFGHCGVGLGSCYYAVHVSFDPAPLDALAEQYVGMQCTNGVCDCAEPPPLTCVDNVCGFGP